MVKSDIHRTIVIALAELDMLKPNGYDYDEQAEHILKRVPDLDKRPNAMWTTELTDADAEKLRVYAHDLEYSISIAKDSLSRLSQEKSILLQYLLDIDPTVNLEKVFRVTNDNNK